MINLRSMLKIRRANMLLITLSAIFVVSCRFKPVDDIGSTGGASHASSISMPIPEKLKAYVGDGKVDAWSMSIIAGSCANGIASPVSHKEKFGMLTSSDVLLSEKITANCAYTLVLSLGKASADKTKLEKVYLTNDLDGKRTEMSIEQNKGGKIPVTVTLYLTAEGSAVLGGVSGNSLDPNSSSNNTLNNNQSSNNGSSNQLNSDPNCYKGDASICKIEFLIAQKTNEYRRKSGLRDLEYDPKIAFVSRDWSAKQARMGDIGHDGFPNSRVAVYRQEFGSAPFLTAENVAYNYCNAGDEEASASAFINQWWNSYGHRQNMLGGHAAIGVGVHRDSRGRCFGTQIFR